MEIFSKVVRLTLIEFRTKGLKLHAIRSSGETYLGQVSHKGLEVARKWLDTFGKNGLRFFRTKGLKLRGEVVGYLWGKGLEVVANKGLEVKGSFEQRA